ncbi:MAG: LPS-assembly protein LptD [Puniceicoccales bacterium]|nr:LPS-assembly protein LptD [Puniceicoccales bacterium]
MLFAAAILFTATRTVFCAQPPPQPATKPETAGEIQIAGERAYSIQGGKIAVFTGPGTIQFGEYLHVLAPEIHVNTQASSISLVGKTQMNFKSFRLLANNASIQNATENKAAAISADTFRFGSPPGLLQGKAFLATQAKGERTTTTTATLENVRLYFHEPDFFSISVDAKRVSLVAPADTPAESSAELDLTDRMEAVRKNSTLYVQDAIVRIANIPVFYLPAYTQQGLDLPPIRPIIRIGQKENIGAFLRTTTYYTGFGKELQPGLLLDAYTKTGILVGPAVEYKFPAISTGNLQGAWVHDNSNRGTDNFASPIAHDRGFLQWEHKQLIANKIQLTSSLRYWSDTSVLRDFRPDAFRSNQNPDNFVELVFPAGSTYLSLFTRFRPNEFQNVQQRLPELRVDIPSSEILNTGIYQHLTTAFAFLYERTSPELALPAAETESTRFDAYYGITRPLKIRDWFSFTPVAGVRATAYFQPLDANGTNQDDPYLRTLPQLGFDAHLLASGQWNFNNEFWEIRGLRHRFRPLVQYRWIPAANKGNDRIPSIDRNVFIPYPPPIDLEQKRYADDLWEQQVLRIGVENAIQTRHPEYGSRTLASFNIYQDFRDTDRPGDRYRSTTYSQLNFSPAYWIELSLLNRLDTYNWRFNETSALVHLRDGDRWHFWFGAQHNTDINDTDQYYWGGEYHLNSNFTLLGNWRYDHNTKRLTEQYYGVRQRLGHTWTIEYHCTYRRDARQDSGFSVGVNLRLSTF